MSWTDELYKIYEFNIKSDDSQNVMLPISHSTANAQIEVILTEDGELVGARRIDDKSESVTIIPVTEDSGSRTSGIAAMPFADKLIYIAGDYKDYVEGKKSDNSEFHNSYMNQLKKWAESEYTHKAVKAVYTYLDKSCIIKDLLNYGVLKADEKGKLDNSKIQNVEQKDAFVRFIINYKDIMHENKTWLDKSLYDSFIGFNNTMIKDFQLCYATGKILPCTYKHPSKIRNAGDKAKLISSNDEEGFTYRGRFSNKKEAISVSYDFSQKMHNALKWLINKQGTSIDSLMLVVWASALQEIPDITKSLDNCLDEEEFPEDEENLVPNSESIYESLLSKMIYGYKSKMDINSKVMVMGLDAATTGRLSIAMYSELEATVFFNNLQKWHSEISWTVFKPALKKNMVDSFSVYQIAQCAFGIEQNGKIQCKPEILKDTVMRLIPCITEGRRLPKDIMINLFEKASNPMAYKRDEKHDNHRIVVETACGIIKKYNIENKEGVTSMALDENNTNRSYLFGRLLAVADKTENDTYDDNDKGKRITNARRYWNNFVSNPYRTWGIIESRLRPYLDKKKGYSVAYAKLVENIMDKMDFEDFTSLKGLEPSYLLGYHSQMKELYTEKNKNEDENNEEE